MFHFSFPSKFIFRQIDSLPAGKAELSNSVERREKEIDDFLNHFNFSDELDGPIKGKFKTAILQIMDDFDMTSLEEKDLLKEIRRHLPQRDLTTSIFDKSGAIDPGIGSNSFIGVPALLFDAIGDAARIAAALLTPDTDWNHYLSVTNKNFENDLLMNMASITEKMLRRKPKNEKMAGQLSLMRLSKDIENNKNGNQTKLTELS